MRGFFDKSQLQAPAYRSGKGIHSCASCGLYKQVTSPRMQPYGEGRKGIMVIGESPGNEDDSTGKPWQGKMGKFLQRTYARLGIDLFEDCVSLNATNCRPTDKQGDDRTPTDHEIACCRSVIVLKAIQQYQPRVIILHGNAAISSLIGYRWKQDLGGIMKWRGWTIPDREFHAWVCPTFHPSYVSRETEDGSIPSEVTIQWEQDLKRAFAKAEEPFPDFVDEQKLVEICTDEDRVEEVLRELNDQSQYNNPPLLALDIETTGLKPYNRDVHQIVCISFCHQEDQSVVIPMPQSHQDRQIRLLRRILEHPRIGKLASNMKYEDTWLNILHGIQVRPWVFDDMQGVHVLDNRPGITGLKFQSYVLFGLLGYDDDIAPYLKGQDSYAPNRIMELVQDPVSFHKLMMYCGIDSLMTFRRSRLQMRQLAQLE